MTKLYLVRHGQTAWNVGEIFRGRADIPLDETGRREAGLAGEALREATIHAVYSSPHQVALPRFSVVALVGLTLNAGLMAIGTRILGLHYLLAQLIATCMVLFNFVASRYWTFARNRPID